MSNKNKSPIVLAILDGWGIGPKDKKINAIECARTPFYDSVAKGPRFCRLEASGESVGLEKNQMSGSESGHLNIGAGRIVKQDVRYILEDIDGGGFFRNPVFLSTINGIRRTKSNIHLMGLMGNSDSPHSHPDIFLALLVLLKRQKFEGRVFIHLFTDGRDSYPESALEHWKKWKNMIDSVGIGQVASICGRFYAMDRVKNWDRLLKAYLLLTNSEGIRFESVQEAIKNAYRKNITDEYIEPSVIVKNGKPIARIQQGDGVFFFNLRSDRARQFSKLFVGTKNVRENHFPKLSEINNISFVAMTNFGPDLNLKTAYHSNPVINTLPLALQNFKQLYIAETEKFAHITYFINGGYSEAIDGEDRIQIKSPNLRSYAEKPEMSALEISQVVSKSIKYGVYDFIAINFANADMVGHTGDFGATVKAVEAVDKILKELHKELAKRDGALIVVADHGNADVMVDKKSKRIFTFHTKNPVPFAISSQNKKFKSIKFADMGILANITPTILDLMDVPKPKEMTEDSLIIH